MIEDRRLLLIPAFAVLLSLMAHAVGLAAMGRADPFWAGLNHLTG